MKDTSSSWTQKINTNGYRLTGARRMVIDIISNSPRALTPAEIFIEARSRGAKLGLVTVYRTLEKLEETTRMAVMRISHMWKVTSTSFSAGFATAWNTSAGMIWFPWQKPSAAAVVMKCRNIGCNWWASARIAAHW
jgi:hypothetical protein